MGHIFENVRVGGDDVGKIGKMRGWIVTKKDDECDGKILKSCRILLNQSSSICQENKK